MADDPAKKGPEDRTRINLSEGYEVRYWTAKFGVTEGALEQAVKTVGSSSAAVEQFFKEHPGARVAKPAVARSVNSSLAAARRGTPQWPCRC